jgi:YfiH family protein
MPRTDTEDFGSTFRLESLPTGRQIGRFGPLNKLPGLMHAVTTKNGPTFPVDADAGEGAYETLTRELGLAHVAWCRQVHGGEVRAVTHGGCADEGDALVTNTAGVGLLARSADCPLILVADPTGTAVGLAHASWRSSLQKISMKLVETMQRLYGVDPANLVACIAPSAGPDRYEVGKDVYDAAIDHLGPAARNFFITQKADPSEPKWLLDLWALNASQLMQAGVDFMGIYTARACTIERHDLFPSHRAEGKAAQRFAAIIGRVAKD